VAVPAFRLVRETFPDAHITLLTSLPIHAKSIAQTTVLDGMGLIDDMLDYPHGLRSPRSVLEFRKKIMAGRFDCLIYMQEPKGGLVTSLRDVAFFLSCGLFRQIGVPLRKHELGFLPDPTTGLYRNVTARLLDCLRPLGRPDIREERWWDLKLSEDENREATRLLQGLDGLGPFVAVSVGTKVDVNDWTEPNWESLVRQLGNRYPGMGIVAMGANHDRDRSERMLEGWSGPKLNLCGESETRVSAAILHRAALFLGHDSGPMHLAAGVGTPCVAVFSGRNPPGKWFPRGEGHRVLYHKTECFGCGLLVCEKHQKKCLMSITVDEVLAAVSDILNPSTSQVANSGV